MHTSVNGTGWHSYVQGLEAAADDVRALKCLGCALYVCLTCLPYMSTLHSYVQGLEAAADDVRALGEHRRKLRAILDTQVRYA